MKDQKMAANIIGITMKMSLAHPCQYLKSSLPYQYQNEFKMRSTKMLLSEMIENFKPLLCIFHCRPISISIF